MRLFIGLAVLAMVATPAWANVLTPSQGDFEDPWPDPDCPWSANMERDSTIWGQDPKCGAHYGSVQTGGHGTREAWLCSIEVPVSEVVTLTGFAAGGTLNAEADLYVQLIDGDSSGDVLQEWRAVIPIATYSFAWTPFTLVGHIGTGHVKILVGLIIHSGWSDGTAIHVDCLDLTPEPASMMLLALAGLPLLRRRR